MRQRSLFQDPPPASFVSRRVEAVPECGGAEGGGSEAFVPLTTLCPETQGSQLKGIARLAAGAVEIDERNEVEYRDLPCRTVVAACDSRRVPFDYTLNPYRGCEFGCVYCYARYTHEYMELEHWLDFERKVFIKCGARATLVNDLRRLDLTGKWLAIGTATDPYQPAERRYGITRAVLEVLAGRRNLQLSVTTKSDLVARDADLLERIGAHNKVHVNLTITTPHYELARRIEPRAPRPDKRLDAVRKLAERGITVGVFVMPVLPRINDRLEDLETLIGAAREAGASYLGAQVLFLRNSSRKRFFPFIEERFPDLAPYYRRLYAANHTEALTNYSRGILAEIQRLKERHGLVGFRTGAGQPGFEPDQLALELG